MKRILIVLFILLIPIASFSNDLAPSAKLQEFNTDGTVCAGCYLYTYDTGTTTPRATKISQSGASNTNPIVLDSAGRASVWLDSSEYRFVLKEDDDSTVLYTIDDISVFPTSGTFSFTSLTATGVDIQDLDGLINIGNRYMIDATEADQGARSSGYPTTLKTVKDYVDNMGASKGVILVFSHSTSSNSTSYTFSTDETILSNFDLLIENGARLDIDSAKTLTVQGNIDAQPFQIKTGSGTLAFTSNAKLEKVYPQWFAAVGDGTNDDTAEIQEAITALNSGGGGTLLFPNGTYLVSDAGSGYAINLLTDTSIVGSGVAATIIKLDDTQDADVFNIDTVSNTRITNLSIDGNKDNQTTGGDGVVITDAAWVTLYNLHIHDTENFGISVASGTSTYVSIDTIYLYNNDENPIDVNNTTGRGSGVHINNIRIEGMVSTAEAAISVTGWGNLLSNIDITDLQSDQYGIHFEDSDNSSLTNFSIQNTSADTTKGIYIDSSSHVQITNGYINISSVGVFITGEYAKIANVNARVCTTGFYFDEDGTDYGVYGTVVNCSSDNSTTAFQVDAEQVRISNSVIVGATTGFDVDANSTSSIFSNNYINAATEVSDGGTTSRFSRNIGYKTENSGTGSVTSGGTTDVITHGLDVTPTIDQITITASEDPTNTPGVIFVNTIGATQFTVNCENDPGASNMDFGWHIANY